jgi:murein DD-endopeptidase MepM/ murein hydrolase activator NlpD
MRSSTLAYGSLVVAVTVTPFVLFQVQKDRMAVIDVKTPVPLASDHGVTLDAGEIAAKKAEAGEPAPYRTETGMVEAGSTVSSTLRKLGMAPGLVHNLIHAARPVRDLARIAAGTELDVKWDNMTDVDPVRIDIHLSETITLVAYYDTEGGGDDREWRFEFKEKPIETRTAAFAGVVESNLWNSATLAGMDPQVIHKIAEVFAWQVDFNREVREGDRWRLTVEQQYLEGKPIGYGELLAAEYENAGVTFTAVRYEHDGFVRQYYQPDGNSLKRMFLKSPLKYGRITSGFSAARFHPILKVNKAHKGVDYGAPTGTPVMSVGNGTVTFAATRGGSGKMITVRHNATYETVYKHLSRYAPGIVAGARVEMGQVIGYVGQTGLATGPHLHFEFHENRRFVDPQGLRFPSADPVPAAQLADFKKVAEKSLAELPPWSKAVLTQRQEKRDGNVSQNE